LLLAAMVHFLKFGVDDFIARPGRPFIAPGCASPLASSKADLLEIGREGERRSIQHYQVFRVLSEVLSDLEIHCGIQ
jgi:hypothetical protein